jgi:PhnB protein
MTTINPYLTFPGNTEEAFNFYRSVFGGEFITVQRFKDTPEADKVSADEQDKIMHIAFPIGGNILMASDASSSMGQSVTYGTNFSISVSAGTEEETARLFNNLSAGGQVTVPLAKMFWGAYFGMFTDKFGINWMVSHDVREQ